MNNINKSTQYIPEQWQGRQKTSELIGSISTNAFVEIGIIEQESSYAQIRHDNFLHAELMNS